MPKNEKENIKMECNHKLIGDAAGVHCLLCGQRWTPDEYAAMCAKPSDKETTPKAKKNGSRERIQPEKEVEADE
jgi:hypothetical protein